MAGMSPTARTIKYLRDQGYIGDVVERFNAYAGKFGQRKDFLGFAETLPTPLSARRCFFQMGA